MSTMEISPRILAALLQKLGGSVTLTHHDLARVHPRTTVKAFETFDPPTLVYEIESPIEHGAIDAEFTVVG